MCAVNLHLQVTSPPRSLFTSEVSAKNRDLALIQWALFTLTHVEPFFCVRTKLETTDQKLVESACSGDIDSFRQLYERHYALVVGLANSRLQDKHLAEDAAQDAFIVACRSLSTLENGTRFPQWIGTITRRIAFAMTKTRRQGVAILDDLQIADAIPIEQDYSSVRHAIGQLSDAHREVIYLHYFSNLSHQQIADATGTTSSSVHGRLQRARKRLEKKLGKSVSEVNRE